MRKVTIAIADKTRAVCATVTAIYEMSEIASSVTLEGEAPWLVASDFWPDRQLNGEQPLVTSIRLCAQSNNHSTSVASEGEEIAHNDCIPQQQEKVWL